MFGSRLRVCATYGSRGYGLLVFYGHGHVDTWIGRSGIDVV